MPERWEGDERGRGVGDASRLRPGAEELVAAMALPGRVAEQPEVHLSPHLRGWLAHSDVFDHADRHERVVLPAGVPVVVFDELDAIGESLLPRAIAGVGDLLA